MNIEDVFAENRYLHKQVATLTVENADLRAKAAEYLANWIAAQDLAYHRMIMGMLEKAPEKASE